MGKTVTKAAAYPGNLAAFLSQYKYLPKLTEELDAFEGEFSPEIIRLMVLWKINRYADLSDSLLTGLDKMRDLEVGKHRDAQPWLVEALRVKGVKLPMASTFLRFANPKVFQIIDGHAYRAVYGCSFEAAARAAKGASKQCELYFQYLDVLHSLCEERRLSFATVDRVLYQFDKDENPPLKESS